jgi:Reverse transcriptase (RNA-dependent DNA polymerase)
MWNMCFIGMVLKASGFTWDTFKMLTYFSLFQSVFVFPPFWSRRAPDKPSRPALSPAAQRKKLLFLSLLVALRSVQGLAHVGSPSESHLRRRIRHATRGRGNAAKLLMTRLNIDEQNSILQALKSLPDTLLDPGDLKSVIADTGASFNATGYKEDFEPGSLKSLAVPIKLDGIAGSLMATHEGNIQSTVLTDCGNSETLSMHGLYMPGLETRLMSPQLYFQQLKKAGKGEGEYTVRADTSFIRLPSGKTISLGYDPVTNLPMLTSFRCIDETASGMAMTCLTDENNQNLPFLSKLLLQWHWKTGHLGFGRLQWAARKGIFGDDAMKWGQTSVHPPKCAACQYGRQQRRPIPGTTKKKDPEHAGILKRDKLGPGDLIFSDQYESRTPGRVFGLRGAHISSQKYCGGTLFTDAATGYIVVQHQQRLTADESIRAKLAFEREALTAGVSVLDYHTDNGIYTSQEYLKELHSKGQGRSLSGVGAHHHNGVAEASIKHVVASARTMQIHAALRWPDASDRELWPLALSHAVALHNMAPNMISGYSPEELWTKSRSSHSRLRNSHVWGCPLYILDPRGQAGHKLPPWDPRSRRAQNMGFSPLHASSVALARNLVTGHISPQFHVVYDDFFETVHSDGADPPDVWSDLIIVQSYRADIDNNAPGDLPELADEWLNPSELADRRRRLLERKQAKTEVKMHDKVSSDDPPIDLDRKPPDGSRKSPPTPPLAVSEEDAPMYDALEEAPIDPLPEEVRSRTSIDHPSSQIFDSTIYDESGLRRSSRNQRPDFRRFAHMLQHSLQSSRILLSRSVRYFIEAPSDMNFAYALLLDPEYGVLDGVVPHLPIPIYKAGKSNVDPDTPDIGAAMSGPHREQYREAMKVEIDQLEALDCWDIVAKSQVPAHANVLPGTWAFKLKRYPDGRPRKFKARFCARGDLQIEGKDYTDKFAPVVSWSTVRMLLCLSISQGWKTRQIDFDNAFVQADIDLPEVYVKCPAGFDSGEHDEQVVLRLKKSLYGLVQAPMLYYNHLKIGLKARGFEPSESDPCMFIGRGMIALSYVDDVLFFGPDLQEIDKVIQELQDAGMPLTIEQDDAYAFLGVDIAPMSQISFEASNEGFYMSQTGLTDKVLKTVGMTDSKQKRTPASSTPLGSDAKGRDFQEDWEYPRVVGMLLYLSSNSRPDIQFAVHQCARFTHNPKQSHGDAVKRICRYLQGTRTRGLIFQPTKEMTLDCYSDADFAGLWSYEPDQDPVCVKSRTGYVLTLAGCPLVWASKLQTEIALSTLESEYISLSTAIRELIPLRRLLQEVGQALNLEFTKPSIIKSTCFEDNNGALGLALTPRLTPRTKHIGVKYHFFKSMIGEDKGIVIQRVDSALQKADIFTKGLSQETFESIRKLLIGW